MLRNLGRAVIVIGLAIFYGAMVLGVSFASPKYISLSLEWNAPALTEASYLGFCEIPEEGVRVHESFQVFA